MRGSDDIRRELRPQIVCMQSKLLQAASVGSPRPSQEDV